MSFFAALRNSMTLKGGANASLASWSTLSHPRVYSLSDFSKYMTLEKLETLPSKNLRHCKRLLAEEFEQKLNVLNKTNVVAPFVTSGTWFGFGEPMIFLVGITVVGGLFIRRRVMIGQFDIAISNINLVLNKRKS